MMPSPPCRVSVLTLLFASLSCAHTTSTHAYSLAARHPAELWVGWPTTTIIRTATVTRTTDGVIGSSVRVSTSVADTTTIWPTGSGTATFYYTTVITVNPSTSTYTTTVTRPSTQSSPTQTPQQQQDPPPWTPADISRFATCQPGDESYEEPGGNSLKLTQEQRITLAALAIMFLVILIGWNLILVRYVLYPLKVCARFSTYFELKLYSCTVSRRRCSVFSFTKADI